MTLPLVPLIHRELRSVRTAAIAALAFASAVAVALASATPPTSRFELLTSERARLALHGVAFALGLVLAWFHVEEERRADTWSGFLMLPVRRSILVGTKAGVGVAAIAVAVGVPALGLALYVALPSGTGGPVDPVVFAAPATVTFAGASAYFAGWVASLAPRSGKVAWVRYLVLGTGALGALLAGASLRGGAAAIAFAALPCIGLGCVAVRLAARPTGASAVDRALVALSLAPVLAAMLAIGATVARVGEGAPPPFQPYVTLDADGDVVRIERDTAGRDVAVRDDGGERLELDSPSARRDHTLSLSPLDRRRFPRRWTQVSYATGALFYNGETRELAYYRRGDGVRVGCLGASGFTLPCAPLDGELIDVVTSPAGDQGVLVVTTRAVLRLDAPSAAPIELVRGDIRAGHTLASERGGVVVDLEGDAVVVRADGVVSRCPVPADAVESPEHPWRALAAATRDGSIAMLATHGDGARTARRCDVGGAVVSDRPVPPEAYTPAPPRDVVASVLVGPLFPVAVGLVSPDFDRGRREPWIAAAFASFVAAGIAAVWARRSLGGIALAALFGLAIGPAYVLAALVVGRPTKRRTHEAYAFNDWRPVSPPP